MCAGSLAPGCRILGIFATRSQVYGALGCHLACLVPLLWRPGGPRDDPGFYRFFVDLGNPFWKLFGYLWTNKGIIFHTYFQVAFSDDFWVWIWVSGIGMPSILQGRYCKNQLSQKLDFLWFQCQFFMILGGLGNNFHDFCRLGDWPEIWWLFRVFLGSSQILRKLRGWRVNSLVGGP